MLSDSKISKYIAAIVVIAAMEIVLFAVIFMFGWRFVNEFTDGLRDGSIDLYAGGAACVIAEGSDEALAEHLAWHEEQHAWDNERFEWVNEQLAACGCNACESVAPTPTPSVCPCPVPTATPPAPTLGPSPTIPAATSTPVDPTPTEPTVPTETPNPTATPQDTPEPTATSTPRPTREPEPTKTKKPPCNHGGGNGSEDCDPGRDPTAANDDGDHTPQP